MKGKLFELYTSMKDVFQKITDAFPDSDLSGPLLMSPNDKYLVQPYPLLIVGQETNGWDDYMDDIQMQMRCYEDFNVGEEYYSSPFWNITRKVENALGNEPYSCAWTNLSKCDAGSTRATGDCGLAISELDNLLTDELQILNPSICIFFTGPDFDNKLKAIFNGIEFQTVGGYNQRQLCLLKHRQLPTFAIRTYHPNYLRQGGYENDFIKFIEKIMN